MSFRIYSETIDEIIDDTLNNVVTTNRGYILIKRINEDYIMFVNSGSQNKLYECLLLRINCGFAIYGYGSAIILSDFSDDERNYILSLYDENIAELFQYMKKRYKNISNYIYDAVENTKSICMIKPAN